MKFDPIKAISSDFAHLAIEHVGPVLMKVSCTDHDGNVLKVKLKKYPPKDEQDFISIDLPKKWRSRS